MPSLGDFTAAMTEADPDPTTFTLHGEVFHLQPTITAYAFLRFSRLAGEVDITDEDQLGAVNLVVLFDVLNDVIIPEDWERFEQTIKKHRVGIDTLMSISGAVMEGGTGRPTVAPSGLPGGASGSSRPSSRKRSATSATKRTAKKTAAKKSTAARSASTRSKKPQSTAEKIAEAVASGEMAPPSRQDAEELARVLGLPVGRTGSTG